MYFNNKDNSLKFGTIHELIVDKPLKFIKEIILEIIFIYVDDVDIYTLFVTLRNFSRRTIAHYKMCNYTLVTNDDGTNFLQLIIEINVI